MAVVFGVQLSSLSAFDIIDTTNQLPTDRGAYNLKVTSGGLDVSDQWSSNFRAMTNDPAASLCSAMQVTIIPPIHPIDAVGASAGSKPGSLLGDLNITITVTTTGGTTTLLTTTVASLAGQLFIPFP